jgi:RHS repeat-associated protein
MVYDGNEWLVQDTLSRSQGPWAGYAQGGSPSPIDYTQQTTLANWTITRDMVGNPTGMTQPDLTYESVVGGYPPGTPAWAPGALPIISRTLRYWDDYRLSSATTTYGGGTGVDVAGVSGNPYTTAELAAATYPPLATPSTGNRVLHQGFGYDLHGNVLTSTDDANDLWDRSLGTVTYTPGTDQLAATSGGATAVYDASGNITAVTTGTGRTFELLFDEVGRLARAVREDPSGTMVAESYTYDAQGERVVIDKTPAYSLPDVYTVNVFDSLVLKNAEFPDANGDYERDTTTEQVYLSAAGQSLGRAFYATGLPAASTSDIHVFLNMGDALGSTSFVVDQGTGEVVESSTYLAYGAVDSDYRPTRWQQPREDVRYTGQWDDAEVGLVYMHARYYLPELGRFISGDPLAVQGARGDLNPYAYAANSPLRVTDPTGMYDQYSPCGLGLAECDDSYEPIHLPQYAGVEDPPNTESSTISNVGHSYLQDISFAEEAQEFRELLGPSEVGLDRATDPRPTPFGARAYYTATSILAVVGVVEPEADVVELAEGTQFHHAFPNEFAPEFEKIFAGTGESIHDYTLELPVSRHAQIHGWLECRLERFSFRRRSAANC